MNDDTINLDMLSNVVEQVTKLRERLMAKEHECDELHTRVTDSVCCIIERDELRALVARLRIAIREIMGWIEANPELAADLPWVAKLKEAVHRTAR